MHAARNGSIDLGYSPAGLNFNHLTIKFVAALIADLIAVLVAESEPIIDNGLVPGMATDFASSRS